MDLSIRDLIELINVPEKTIRQWIKQGSIPVYQVQEQYRFNRTEILEWATSQGITVSARLFDEPKINSLTGFADAIQAGGIFYGISATDKKSALQAVVERMLLPENINRDYLLQFLLAREAMASTGIGDGIAIPHVRNPIVLPVNRSMVTLCFLEKSIDFSALDGKPVQALFALVAPTVRAHLHLLSRMSFALKNPEFHKAVKQQEPAETLLEIARAVESGLNTEPGREV
jgi:PTS system nitrogen regulatory IIA component